MRPRTIRLLAPPVMVITAVLISAISRFDRPMFAAASSLSAPQGQDRVDREENRLDNSSRTFVGVVRPSRISRLAAEVDGVVAAREVEENRYVEKSVRVLALDDTIKAAALEVARADLAEAVARLEQAASTLKRANEMHRSAVASAADHDAAVAGEHIAHAAVKRAEALLSVAEFELRKTAVVAPFAGVVIGFDAEVGEYLRPGDPVCTIMDVAEVKIETFVDADVAAQLRGDAGVTIEIGGQHEGISARLDSVAVATDNEARTFKVIVRAANPEAPTKVLLRPGATVRWRLDDDDEGR